MNRPLKRLLALVGVGAVLATGSVVGVALPASAHTGGVTGVAVCQPDNTYTVTWTYSANYVPAGAEAETKAMTTSQGSLAPIDGVNKGGQIFLSTWTQHQINNPGVPVRTGNWSAQFKTVGIPGNFVGNVTTMVQTDWLNGPSEDPVGSVYIEGSCTPPVVTPDTAKFDVGISPATCEVGQTLSYGEGNITNASYDASSTPSGTVGPASYSVSATPNANAVFAEGTVNPVTGTLSGPIPSQNTDPAAPCYNAPPVPVEPSVEATSWSGTCDDNFGGFEYTVTVGSAGGDRTFYVKNLGNGTGGQAETYFAADGTPGAPGVIVPFATVAAGESATLTLDGLAPGNYRVVSDGSQQVKAIYKFDFTITDAGVCPPTNTCPGVITGDTSTNVNDLWVNIDTRATGHQEYVPGGLRVWTEGSTSTDKVSEGRAVSFPLKNTGVVSLDYSAEIGNVKPGVNLFVTFAPGVNGTLVFEPTYADGSPLYGQDAWLTNGSSQAAKDNAPVNGGGNGSQWHGTVDQWLSVYPDAQVTGIAYSAGSGVYLDGIIHSINVGCTTFYFDYVPLTPVVPAPIVEQATASCVEGESVVANGSFTLPAAEGIRYRDEEGNLFTSVTNDDAAPGTYTYTAIAPEGWVYDQSFEQVVTVVIETPAPADCPKPPVTPTPDPTPTDTPVPTDDGQGGDEGLANTGGVIAWGAAVAGALALLAGILMVRRRQTA